MTSMKSSEMQYSTRVYRIYMHIRKFYPQLAEDDLRVEQNVLVFSSRTPTDGWKVWSGSSLVKKMQFFFAHLPGLKLIDLQASLTLYHPV